ncbi:hypothetical protein L1887_57776 [Cichorium endivia]|nr:hypothetical protein L1887_57776 [Cichorium endivia]
MRGCAWRHLEAAPEQFDVSLPSCELTGPPTSIRPAAASHAHFVFLHMVTIKETRRRVSCAMSAQVGESMPVRLCESHTDLDLRCKYTKSRLLDKAADSGSQDRCVGPSLWPESRKGQKFLHHALAKLGHA